MALTRARTASETSTGEGTLKGRGTAKMHQVCLAEGCDGRDPPRSCNTLRFSSHRAAQHLQQELSTFRVLQSCIGLIRWRNHHIHQQTSRHAGLHSHSTNFFFGIRGMQTPHCPQISSFLGCSWVDLHPLSLPAASFSPCSLSLCRQRWFFNDPDHTNIFWPHINAFIPPPPHP